LEAAALVSSASAEAAALVSPASAEAAGPASAAAAAVVSPASAEAAGGNKAAYLAKWLVRSLAALASCVAFIAASVCLARSRLAERSSIAMWSASPRLESATSSARLLGWSAMWRSRLTTHTFEGSVLRWSHNIWQHVDQYTVIFRGNERMQM